MKKKVTIIAEVKIRSPFGWTSEKTWEECFDLATEVGDMVSIHTDARWGGSFELLKKARGLTQKPILAKGIHLTDAEVQQAVDAGADYVLVVGRIPNVHQKKCFIEPLTLQELKMIPQDLKVVWNSRDLSTGKMKTETWKEARDLFKGWLCQASNITTTKDIEKDADAVLVGTRLFDFADSLWNG